jgi:hypothetical protein
MTEGTDGHAPPQPPICPTSPSPGPLTCQTQGEAQGACRLQEDLGITHTDLSFAGLQTPLRAGRVAAPRDVHILVFESWDRVASRGKKDFVGTIKLGF